MSIERAKDGRVNRIRNQLDSVVAKKRALLDALQYPTCGCYETDRNAGKILSSSPPGLMRMIFRVIGIQLRATTTFLHESFASERVMAPSRKWVLIRQCPNDR